MYEESIKTNEEGAKIRFYLNKPNARGWSVVYLSCAFGDEASRISCGLKVKADYWKKGEIRLPWSATKTERLLHQRVESMMQKIKDVIDDATVNFFNGDTVSVINATKQFITTVIMKKKKTRFIPIWEGIVYEYPNKRTQTTCLGYIGVFKSFMKECNVEDDISNLTTSTVRNFRDWLATKQTHTAKSANDLIKYIGRTLCNKMKMKGLEHSVDMRAVELFKELASKAEINESKVALSVAEIEALRNVNLEGVQKTIRDLFLIQCWGGCRHEDLGLFLSSKNRYTSEGEDLIRFTPQKTGKEGSTSRVPLQSFFPLLKGLWETYKDYDDNILRDRYNRNLKRIAKLANLNREVTVTQTRGGKKNIEVKKVFDLLTSHDGRRTFITSMIRDFGCTAEDVIEMSGHTDTKMVNNVYLTLSKTEKDSKVMKRAKELTMGKSSTYNPTSTPPNRSNNYLIEGLEEAKSVMRYLSIDFDDNISFDDAMSEISKRQWELVDNYGVKVETLKDLFNYGLPLPKRVEMLRSVLEALSR